MTIYLGWSGGLPGECPSISLKMHTPGVVGSAELHMERSFDTELNGQAMAQTLSDFSGVYEITSNVWSEFAMARLNIPRGTWIP